MLSEKDKMLQGLAHQAYSDELVAMRLRAKEVRIFFIYGTFATLGAGFGVYLLLASLLRIKDVFFVKRTSVFDL